MSNKKQNNRNNNNGRNKHMNRPGSSNNAHRARNQYKQNLDKYLSLAKDAISNGDEIAAEGFFQHAEHFYRQLSELGFFQGGERKNPSNQDSISKNKAESQESTSPSTQEIVVEELSPQVEPIEIIVDSEEKNTDL